MPVASYLLASSEAGFQQACDPVAELEAAGARPLAQACSRLLRGRACWACLRTRTRTDAGAWFVFPHWWLLISDDAVHLVAHAPAWLGGRLQHRRLQWSAVDAVAYNDVTAQLLICSPVPGYDFPALSLDPVAGYHARTCCERLLHDHR